MSADQSRGTRDALGRFIEPPNKGMSPHGYLRYRRGCRCLACRRDEANRVRAASERACETCGWPCWGRRCMECIRRDAKKQAPVQPRGLHYQWGCP